MTFTVESSCVFVSYAQCKIDVGFYIGSLTPCLPSILLDPSTDAGMGTGTRGAPTCFYSSPYADDNNRAIADALDAGEFVEVEGGYVVADDV
jgi:hypothetical protein